MTENNIQKYINLLEEDVYKSIHLPAFKDIYNAIKEFADQSQRIHSYIKEHPDSNNDNYIHEVLCGLPGHGKTTALKYHIKQEIAQSHSKKHPYLLVFNNNDTMNDFFTEVNQFANQHGKKYSVLAVNEQNLEQYKLVLGQYQVIFILQQRLRDLAIGFGDYHSFMKYKQENYYWGDKPNTIDKTTVHRTIIIDEMPDFFNKEVFDIGSENNAVDWFDTFSNNTNENQLSSDDKNKGRLYISKLITRELHSIGRSTKRLIRSIEATQTEKELISILDSLNKSNTDNKSVNRFKWFMKLLNEDDTGSINQTSKKTNILCSSFIDYKSFGNILVLDGTSNLTHTIYERAGFKLKLIHNYHRYIERLFFEWGKINTSSRKRSNEKSEIREQIAENIIEKRNKGLNILAIPSKGDINFYISVGAITPEQQEKFFLGRQLEGDSLAINLHNVTGKNDLSSYNHIALLNLPIMQPDEYRLQAIAMYGTDTDLRLVKELDKEEQSLHKNKWFVDSHLQNLFQEHQKAELSQIIHRSSIRNINSDEMVTIHLYHNKKQMNELLKGVFQLTDENFNQVNIQQNNNFKVKCKKWAEKIIIHLKNNPNEEYTAFSAGGKSFKKWLDNYWKEHEVIIREIFQEHEITIQIKGKGSYKYFTYIDDEDLRYLIDHEDELENILA
jgi:hypothetical protein